MSNKTITRKTRVSVNLFKKINFYKQLFYSIGILSIIFFSVLYVFQVNAEISEKYTVQQFQKELAQLKEKNDDLAVDSIQDNSLDNFTLLSKNTDSHQLLSFEKPKKIHYIQVSGNQLIAKNNEF